LTWGAVRKTEGFNPSYSPENTPRNSDNQICINATMDIGFAKELLTNLVAACEQLGIEEQGVERWKNMLTKMPDYMINRDGAVKEWTTDKLEENYAHRHAAHLCHLADRLPQDIANDPRLREGFRKAVELKMESRRKAHNRVGVMAFGIVELGQAATSLKDADLSYEAVDMIANRFWRATNMTPTHDPGGVFNMDAAGGLPAVIIKMLVMSEVGGIDLLPALPKEWPSGTIEGVLCRGQIG
jgi:alpha-L-fucosidase 2